MIRRHQRNILRLPHAEQLSVQPVTAMLHCACEFVWAGFARHFVVDSADDLRPIQHPFRFNPATGQVITLRTLSMPVCIDVSRPPSSFANTAGTCAIVR